MNAGLLIRSLAVGLLIGLFSPVSAQLIGDRGVAGSDSQTQIHEPQSDDQLNRIRSAIEPYGASLFSGGFGSDDTSGLNADYVVSPGDQVSVRIWGATAYDAVQTVDSQGNIFIPNVGPVKLGGVPNKSVNSRVRNTIGRVYTNDVEVYTNLITAQTVSVYVTGSVLKPGKYSGVPSTSVLNFIDKAGGIDSASGSYREIDIIRGKKRLASVDLYEFIRRGVIPDVVFKEGDAILIKPMKTAVSVQGNVSKAHRYEFVKDSVTGGDVTGLAMPGPSTTHVAISRIVDGKTVFDYIRLREFSSYLLGDGDVVSFRSDLEEKNITINVAGAFSGASALTVGRKATLKQVLDLIEVDPELSAYKRIFIQRKSIAQRQKVAISESLRRLESEFMTASSSSDGESKIRAQEAQLISDFVGKVAAVEPQGTLVVVGKGGLADIGLENDDTIFIPRRNPSVLVTGEVRLPRAFLWQSGDDARDYIKQAGGYSNNANRGGVLLVKQDGRVIEAVGNAIEPGDELLILPKAPTKNVQLATGITDILYKIAVATKVALSI